MKAVLVKTYNWIYPIFRRLRFNMRYRFRVMSQEQTIAYIKKHHCSIARYGDGEFGLITKTNHPDFQSNDNRLAERLAQICNIQDQRILICIPHNFKHTRDCNEFARKFWEWWSWEQDNLAHVAKLLGLNHWRARAFGDAQITRPYMDWKDKSRCGQRFKDLTSLWDGRDVLIVEGTQTKLGVGNDLLQNAGSIRRILAPSKNAFVVYDRLLSAAKSEGRNRLVLLALGPTATVLAYDLAMAGIQALDIGHIDIEYEWFLQGADHKTTIAGKATQEAHEQNVNDMEENETYLSQIVSRIESKEEICH